MFLRIIKRIIDQKIDEAKAEIIKTCDTKIAKNSDCMFNYIADTKAEILGKVDVDIKDIYDKTSALVNQLTKEVADMRTLIDLTNRRIDLTNKTSQLNTNTMNDYIANNKSILSSILKCFK